jgi:copper(I)-binding protein
MKSRRILTLAGMLTAFAMAAPVDAHEFSANGITVAHPWTRATPAGAKVGAAYLTITAAPGEGDTLIGATTDAARVAELHTHVMDGDVMKMRKVETVGIAGGKTVLFQPSGHHVMLIDLVKPLKEGDTVKLVLKFKKAGDIPTEATVEPIGAKGPHGLSYQPAADGSDPNAGSSAGDQAGMHHHH